MSPALRRALVPALLVTVGTVPAARAQLTSHQGGAGSVKVTADVYSHAAEKTDSYDGTNPGFGVSAGVGSGYGTATGAGTADAQKGQLHALAVTSGTRTDAYTTVSMMERITVASLNPFASVPLEMFFHGSINGTNPVNPYAPRTQASGYMTVTIYDHTFYTGGPSIYSKQFFIETDGTVPNKTAADSALVELNTRGFSIFDIVWQLEAHASNGYTADFGQTATLYIPPTPGVTVTGADGFLSQQARPAWAGGTTATVTPEPASLALVGAGLLALGGAVRRRRQATA